MARTSTRAPSPTRLEATAWPAGPGRSAGGRRQGLAKQQANAPSNISDLAPLVWRAPEGPVGLAAAAVGGRGACGTWTAPQAPPVWRAPEGPEGTGGLRGAAPNEVRSPSLAGGRALRRPEHQRGHKHQHAARTASGRAAAHRHTQRPGPSRQATRRPEHPWVHKQRRRSGGSASGTATTGGRKAYSPRNALIAGISRTACTRPAR